MANDDYQSWGRLRQKTREARSMTTLISKEREINDVSLLAYGNGRSYGDSCHNDSGMLIDLCQTETILDFDADNGFLRCGAGVLLSDILKVIIPKEYFLPVSPGTRYVTVGGAVANDVHGKNHHTRGTFGCHVTRFSLWRSDGVCRECSPHENVELFQATIGGMGLTGILLDVTMRLMKVPCANVRQQTRKLQSLEDYFSQIEAIDQHHEYSVAWIDQLARGRSLGRGILMAANHSGHNSGSEPVKDSRLSVPFQPPVNLLNNLTLKAFNGLYYAREKAGEKEVSWSSYFYPLDGIKNWNRLYGPRGLFQHQSIYPFENAEETTVKLLECAQMHGHASFLTVLKRFGSIASPGLLSFPCPGVTLTLDFSNQGKATRTMLDALDEIVMKSGGRINPYKDARMSAETFASSFHHWAELENRRDPAIMSDFWRRTAKLLPSDEMKNAEI